MVESAQLENPVIAAATASETRTEPSTRLVSLDAFRGLVMTLMLAEVMRLPVVAQAFPHSLFWRIVGFNTDHVQWQGCSRGNRFKNQTSNAQERFEFLFQ